MKPILLLASLLALTACNDNSSDGSNPVPPVVEPPVVIPPVIDPPIVTPPIVTPPVEPPLQTHTRADLTLAIDLGDRLAPGATLSLRQRATGIGSSVTLSGQGDTTLTLPAGLLLSAPLELSGEQDGYILRASSALVADLAAGDNRARRAAAPTLRLDEEETALFLLSDRNGDGALDASEWGQGSEIRLQQQAAIQDYATLLRAQRLGAELNYPDSWQMLLALRGDSAARSWYRRTNEAAIQAAQLALYPTKPVIPGEPETAELLRLDEQGKLLTQGAWHCLHDVRSVSGVKGSQYWLPGKGFMSSAATPRDMLLQRPTDCGQTGWRLPTLVEFERLLTTDKQGWRYPHTFAIALPQQIWLQDGAKERLYQPQTRSWLDEGEGSLLWYALALYPVRPSVVRDGVMPDLAALRAQYAGDSSQWPAANVDEGVQWQELGAMPAVSFPADNPYSRAKVVLGQQLFFDKQLSQARDISRASCHDPQKGWSDGLSVSVGHLGQKGTRNAPTILNAAYSSTQFWDGRVGSLEEQSLHPINNPVEMALDHDELLVRLRASPDYPAAFATAFGDDHISLDRVAKAIATFERTIISSPSPLERFVKGDAQALSDKALWGMHLFRTDGRCMNCHSGPLLSQHQFESVGLTYYGRNLEDRGRFLQTRQQADMGLFKTPSLRDVAFTGPYMHNGVFPILAQRLGGSVQGVVAMYNFGVTKWSSGVGFPTGADQHDPFFPKASDHLHALGLTNDELDAIGEFLRGASAEPRRTPASVAELGLSKVDDARPVGAIPIDLVVTPALPQLEVGRTLALQLALRLSDGSLAQLTEPATWSSELPELARVDGQGMVSGLAVGPARVRVSAGGRTLAVRVQVVDAEPDFSQGCHQPELAAGKLSFVCPLTQSEADRLKITYDDVANDEDGDYNPFSANYAMMSQQRARDYCQQLVARGHDDWRLPTAQELAGLFAAHHQGGEEMKLLTDKGWPLYSRFWSSDASNGDGEAPLLDLGTGEPLTDVPAEAHAAACVRAI
ncbi:cytochrome c peroxidase [Aeromonas eucrenophila]|uniref:Cytochrome c peroxidase n=1 Tax=Aeromonas eucrenophila TaxID=649 RepID=A0ABW0YF11_9GAMM